MLILDKLPDRMSLIGACGGALIGREMLDPLSYALELAILFKVLESIGDVVVGQELKEEVVKLEGEWKLTHKLVDSVKKLQKDWRYV